MADNDPVEWTLLDDDFSTKLGILPSSEGNLYIELNEPGSGSLRIPLAAPIASQITEGQFVQCNYRGAARGGFFVDNIRKEEADSQEGAGRWLAVSGRGALAILDDAIVWDDGTGASTRAFTGTKAGILVTLIDENKAKGIITNVEMSFDATEDTTEDAWTDDEDLELTVGRSLLDILREFSKAGGIDFTVDIETNGDFTLNAYKDGIGTNKSSTIYFRVGLNCEEVKEERVGSQVKNDMLIKYRDGFVRVSDSTSASTYRRRAKIINIEAAQSTQSATTFGAAQLEIEKDPRRSIPIAVYDGVEPNVFLDYILGDFVTLDRFGTETSDRIVGLQLSFDDAGIAHVIISLNDIITENNIKFGRDLEWLLKQWNTARDSKLLEARFWAELGLSTDTITTIHAIYRSGNTLYVAGGFLGIGGVLSPGVIQYDIPSATWSIISLANNFNGTAYTVLYHNGVVYAGGNSSNVYAFTTSWAAIGIGSFLSSVYALATDGEDIYAGGDFTSMGGASGEIARYDVSENTWVTMGTTPGSTCYTLLWHNGELYAGGLFGVEKWNGSSWSTVGAVGGTVYSLASRGSEIIAGGAFTGGVKVWDGSAWSLLGGGVNGTVRAVTVYLTDVYIGGEFTDAGSYVARYNGLWDTLDGGTNNIVYALEIDDNQTLFAGGTFTVAGDKAINKIGAYYVSFAGLLDYLEKNKGMFDLAAAIHGATAKTSMTGNDEFGMWDSITGLLRKITWSNILLSIKTYTDGLYVALTGNQSVDGVKTFTSFPVTPSDAPTTDYQVANKKYVDDNAGGGTPAGSDGNIQYNDDGDFGGVSTFNRNANGSINIGTVSSLLEPQAYDINQGANDSSVAHFLQSFGASVASYFTFFRARGSNTSPEAVQTDDVLGRIRARGHDGSTFPTTRAEIRFVADADWDTGNHAIRVEIWTTPDGETAQELIATFGGDGFVMANGKDTPFKTWLFGVLAESGKVLSQDFTDNADGWTLGTGWSWSTGVGLVKTPGVESSASYPGALDRRSYRVEIGVTVNAGQINVYLGDSSGILIDSSGDYLYQDIWGDSGDIAEIVASDDFDGVIEYIIIDTDRNIYDAPLSSKKYVRTRGEWIEASAANITVDESGFAGNLAGEDVIDVQALADWVDGVQLQDGYQLLPSVTSNNLTLALKNKDGNDPSPSAPVRVKIGGVLREITGALSVTRNAGTNWFGSGAASLAAQEIDYFAYLGYNATDGVVLGFARIPYAGTYADFSTTSTSDRYAAISTTTNAASSDAYVVIGRFAATLSAAAGHNWSVPTYTNTNLKHKTIYSTRRLSYAPQWASTGTQPAIVNGTITGEYVIDGHQVKATVWQVNGSSTTYGTGVYTWTLPITAPTLTNHNFVGLARVFDASPTGFYVGVSVVSSGATTGSIATHGATGSMSGTVPFTLAQNDTIGITFLYNI